MNMGILRGLLPCALALASFPALAQSVRLVTQGPAFAYAEDISIADQIVDQIVGASVVGDGAQIVFYRPSGKGSANVSLSGDGAAMAELPAGAFYAVAVTPGVHTYTVDGRPLRVEVAPGARRFVRISDGAQPQLVPSQALTFLRLSMNMRPPLLN